MPFPAKSETSGMSRTPSLGLPKTDCHDGLAYPAQEPFTTPYVEGDPVAQPLGPPLPEAVVNKLFEEARELLQKPLRP